MMLINRKTIKIIYAIQDLFIKVKYKSSELLDLISSRLCPYCQKNPCIGCNTKELNNFKDSIKNSANSQLFFAAYYQGKLKKLMLRFKYGEQDIGYFFARVLAAYWQKNEKAILDLYDLVNNTEIIICEIPLYKSKQRKRSYNQAELIAQDFYKNIQAKSSLKFRMSKGLLKRQKISPKLSNKSLNERKSLIQSTFSVDPQQVNLILPSSQVILIIDDISTTGATMLEAQRALKSINPSLKCISLSCLGNNYD